MTPASEDFWFLPLGSTGEIGMNMNLYGHDGQWLMVDCGVIFDKNTDVDGIVRWCRKDGTAFLVAVAFQEKSDTFTMRMVEQICHIDNYRQQMKLEHNIELSSEQAAIEWISKYAHEFTQI